MSAEKTADILMQARQLANRGQLADARHLAGLACQVDENNPGAWQLLGNIQGRLEEYGDAIRCFRNAVTLAPNIPETHLGLVNALIADQRIDEAISACGNAAELHPDNPAVLFMLGSLHIRQKNFRGASSLLGRVLELAPAHPLAHHALGAIRQAQGKLDDAARSYRKAVQYKADFAQAHNDLGVACQLLGRLPEAADSYREVLRLQPDNALAWYNLGSVLREQDKLEEAGECLRKSLQLEHNFPEAHNTLGLVQQSIGLVSDAESHYRAAISTRPGYVDALLNLGGLLMTRLSRPDESRACFEAALAADPDNPKAHFALGNARRRLGELEGALECYKRALSIDPGYRKARANMAAVREHQGEHEAALALLEPLLDDASDAEVLVAFASVSLHFNLEGKAIGLIESALGQDNLPSADRLTLHFSAGELYNSQGEYAAAFEHYRKGNVLKEVEFDLGTYVHLFDSLRKIYNREAIGTHDRSRIIDRQPIFIIGMPRSGTSLAEQILACHPQVQAAGELNSFNRFTVHMHNTFSLDRPYPDCVHLLTQEHLTAMHEQYMDNLPDEGSNKPFFTDKMPHNFLHLGLIRQVFPNARVIHCTRNALDTCLSCYVRDFHGEHPYAYDLESLGQYYRLYRQLMSHWESVLDIPIHTLDYEQLVNDQELEIRKLVEFCGLEWDDQCLAFHTSRRIVNTASYNQVRRPIYSSSIGQWKHYETDIQPLMHALKSPLPGEASQTPNGRGDKIP